MADGTAGPPSEELGRSSKDIGANANKGPEQKSFGRPGIPSARPQEFGRIDLTTTPYGADVKALQTQYFPEGKHFLTTFVIADSPSGEPQNLEPDKCDGWEWLDWNALPAPLFLPLDALRKTGFRPT